MLLLLPLARFQLSKATVTVTSVWVCVVLELELPVVLPVVVPIAVDVSADVPVDVRVDVAVDARVDAPVGTCSCDGTCRTVPVPSGVRTREPTLIPKRVVLRKEWKVRLAVPPWGDKGMQAAGRGPGPCKFAVG